MICVTFWFPSETLVSPPPKLSSSEVQVLDINQKSCKRMWWTWSDYSSNRLQLKSFLNSKKLSTFHGVSRYFAKTKFAKTRHSQKLDPIWNWLRCEPLKLVLGSKQTREWKYGSEKFEFETCKTYNDPKDIWSKIISSFNCACLNHSRTLV